MKVQHIWNWSRFAAVTALSAALTVAVLTGVSAFAADISADSLKLAPGVTKAAEGYETPPPVNYVVANPTGIFSNHSFYDTKITGDLKRGEHVQALAKVKGYDWLLVGKNGMGIGYVSISMLAPENEYHAS